MITNGNFGLKKSYTNINKNQLFKMKIFSRTSSHNLQWKKMPLI